MNVVEAALPLIRLALAEDLGAAGDLTTNATVPGPVWSAARIVARQPGVLAGIDVARLAFQEVEPEIEFEAVVSDGARLAAGAAVAVLRGPSRGILTAERTALNFLQRLSGVATLTRRFVDAVAGTGVAILDTRKTTPGYRELEKYAVTAGGGRNHRHGLYDMVLIKDNHIEAAGGVAAALERVAPLRQRGIRIEIEIQSPEQLETALGAGCDGILLDNMTPPEVERAVARIQRAGPRPWVEVSGGVTLETVRSFALPGVDFISIGALTHSAPALDLALDLGPPA